MKNILFIIFTAWSVCCYAQPGLDSIPPIDSLPPLQCGVQGLQGQIDCFPFAPNQGQLQVMWEPSAPGCEPIGFYRGDDLDNLQFVPYGQWFFNSFYGGVPSSPVSNDEYYFIVESPGEIMDTLVLENPNCGIGCLDSLATNYNPFAGIESEFGESCQYGEVSECGDLFTQKVYVSITADTYSQWETSWEIVTTDSIPVVLASEDIGFYQTEGLTVTTEYCIPLGVEFTFNIYDTFGDGLAGSTTGGFTDGDVLVYTECGNTIYSILPFEGQNPDYGYEAISEPNLLNPCPPENPPFGCLDPEYLEFNSLATNNDSSLCITPAVPGCLNENAFNYDPEANIMDYIPECEYTLMLFDGGGDGWDGSYLGVVQDGNPIGVFTCTEEQAFYDITVSSQTHVEFKFYEVEFGSFFGEGGTSTDVSQCGFKLISPNGNIVFEKGTNPWLDPIDPDQVYTPYLRCGNYCEPYTYGCTDENAQNYIAEVNTEDGSCYYQAGCTQAGYLEYYTQGYEADYDNGDCQTLAVFGCTDEDAFNYNEEANVDNEGCIPVVLGCMNPLAYNYLPSANVDDDSCIPYIYGCMDPGAFNYDPDANIDDGECEPFIYGCTDDTMFNFNPAANAEYDPSNCEPYVYGCTDPSMLNYDSSANTEDFSCIPYIYGCTDSSAFNYDPAANTDNGSCIETVEDCMDPDAYNYNALANVSNADACLYDAGCITGPGEPYWLNDECYAWTIDVDPYCCSTAWDETCITLYQYCDDNFVGIPDIHDVYGVYPNPTQGIVIINSIVPVSVDVYDSNGRKIITGQTDNRLDLSSFANGTYIAVIYANNRIYKQTIIKS